MNKIVKTLQQKLNDFVRELQQHPPYLNIMAEYDFTDNVGGQGVSVTSNAGMWLSHSLMMHKEIDDFIKQEYAELSTNEPLSVRIKFSRMKDTKNDSSTTSTKPVGIKKKTDDMEQVQFIPETPKYKLEDVILSEETTQSIKEAIATIENFDIVYNQWNFRSKEPSAKTNICFYGAPGTGKTMCAHAIAQSLGKQILIASYADIQSQYVGVGPKNLKAVFQVAEEKGALLFFDEADSFLRKRTSDNSSSASMHYNSMTNEMMKHLEDFNGIVIFATNLTENTDEAFKTRLSFSIEFKVPDEECRAKIIEKMIPEQVPLETPFNAEDYFELSQVCDGFVGRDIRNAVKTILSVGAQNKTYPFTKDQFIEGFKKYQSDKSAFEKNSNSQKDKKSNPLDVYTANGCIQNLLTYAAWVDGKENELEADNLKLFSKILSRTKLVINSVRDLPEFEEICHEVTDDELKKKVLRYLAFFMAMSNQEDSLFYELSEKLSQQFKMNENSTTRINEYYEQVKRLAQIKEGI